MLPDSIVIEPPAFDPVAAIWIGGIAALIAIFVPLVLTQGDRGRALCWLLVVIAVMAISGGLASTGVLARFDLFPPPMAIMIATVVVGGIGIGVSPFGGGIVQQTPLLTLVGLQSFRLTLELVMHRAAEQGIIPVQLSYSGYNFDIVTGMGATVLYVPMELDFRGTCGGYGTSGGSSA